jgi:GTPase Era involved in 16S rRNA processing
MIDDHLMDIMKEKLSVEEYSQFLLRLIGSYDWDQQKKAAIEAGLARIVARKDDECLYLGIIGEFSSGKTTLINCLLQKNLLKTHAIQGTTTLTTFIEFADQSDLILELITGSSLRYRGDRNAILNMVEAHQENVDMTGHATLGEGEDEMGFLARIITTGNAYARHIRHVRLLYPSELLRKGIVIIDTPGVDSENEEHLNTTANAIREHCDLSLVMVPANSPVSQTLTNFLSEHVPESLHRCRFMLTKPETLRTEKDRADVLQFTAARLASNLQLDHVALIPAPTALVLEEQGVMALELPLNLSPQQRASLTTGFRMALAEVFDRLEKEKWVILAEKMVRLINTLVSGLGSELSRFETAYDQQHAQLQKNRTTDLQDFIFLKTQEYQGKQNESLEAVLNEVNGCIASEQLSAVRSFTSDLSHAGTRNDIFRVVDQANMERVLKKSVQKIQETFERVIKAIDERRHQDFDTKFKMLYQELAALQDGRLVSAGERLPAELTKLHVDLHLTNDSLAKKMTDAMAQETVMDKLSSALDDKFGTSLNDKLGAFKKGYSEVVPKIEESIREGLSKGVESLEEHLPWLAKRVKKYLPDTLPKLRSQVIDKTEVELAKYFNSVKERVRTEIPLAIDKIAVRLEAYCRRYKTVYGDLVAAMMEKDRLKNEDLDRLRRRVHADQESLRIRGEHLQGLTTFFKSI